MEIAKDMKKDVLITIKGTQRVGGESDVIEMMTTGRFYRKNKLYYISYEETEATGYEGCRTTLKVGPNDKVTMTRFGPSRSQLIVEQGVRHQCQYDTGYGAMTIGVNTRHLLADLNDQGGDIEIDYAIEIDHAIAGRNVFQIQVKEAQGLSLKQ